MSDIRQRFPLLQHKTYLNSCSYGALEEGVEASILTYLRDRREHGACWEKWVAQLEILRGKTAELLGADADEIAIVPSLTAGFNALVSCLANEPQSRLEAIGPVAPGQWFFGLVGAAGITTRALGD